jgi:hypothetical protein
VSTTLRGAAGQDYELTLAAQNFLSIARYARGSAPGARPFVTSPGPEPASKGTIFISKFDLRAPDPGTERMTELRRRALAPDHPEVLATRGTSLIDTFFRMDIGETVVVGTRASWVTRR